MEAETVVQPFQEEKFEENRQEEAVANSAMEEIADNVKEILAQVQNFAHKDKINNDLHEELQKYKSGLRMEFVSPVLKAIIREYDRITQLHDFYLKKLQEEPQYCKEAPKFRLWNREFLLNKLQEESQPQDELFSKLLKEFNFIALSLLDILDDYNFIPFEAQAGDDYNPREHKIVKIISAETEEQNGKVEKCVACGFRNSESGRLIRLAEINIYKLNK